jgi:hypothetical protein
VPRDIAEQVRTDRLKVTLLEGRRIEQPCAGETQDIIPTTRCAALRP